MRCLPLRGKKTVFETLPGLSSNVHGNTLAVHESYLAILNYRFRNRRHSCVTRRPGFVFLCLSSNFISCKKRSRHIDLKSLIHTKVQCLLNAI
jgi:hypothetical protein